MFSFIHFAPFLRPVYVHRFEFVTIPITISVIVILVVDQDRRCPITAEDGHELMDLRTYLIIKVRSRPSLLSV